MQLNRALLILCLVISVDAQREHRVTCFLDALTHHTREGLCTHIVVPTASSDDRLHLQSLSEDEYATLSKMQERNPTLKILLGLEVKTSRLELMSANESSVENFMHTALRYLKEKNLDGLDLTWLDDPVSEHSSKSTELFMNFLKSLRGEIEKKTRLSGNQSLLLSVSVPDHTDHSSAVRYDERTLSQYVDYISLLPAHLEKDGPYINKTVQHWQDQQVDLQKLNLAMPAFLRRSRRRHHHRDQPRNDDLNTKEEKKDHIHGVSLMLASQVCQAIKSGQEQFLTLTSLSDEQSLVEEVSWLYEKGYGGVGIVFIDIDGFGNTICADSTQDERAIVESKVVVHSHHEHRGHGDQHHRRDHHHSHREHHHSPNPSYVLDDGHHHRGHHRHGHHGHPHHGHHRHGHRHHGHRHHGHHHHHHHPHPHPTTPQSIMATEGQQGLE
ncbi:chitotriosidase-1-like [Myxocyprinus asiaticus]|uniref:chitotriosidase-1-like n=1 Tax=Myxocyprinus asiaticus TaxID=70543 RepID=UPI002222B73B|nr:chitotriosidase-1-like [Myxocyprinus asiaticus]